MVIKDPTKIIRPNDPGGTTTLKLVALLAGIAVLIIGSCIMDSSIEESLKNIKEIVRATNR